MSSSSSSAAAIDSALSALISTAECACCSTSRLSLVRLRRFNSICIGCCCLLGIGTATLSTYLIYKLVKFKRRMDEIERTLQNLSIELSLIDDRSDHLFTDDSKSNTFSDNRVVVQSHPVMETLALATSNVPCPSPHVSRRDGERLTETSTTTKPTSPPTPSATTMMTTTKATTGIMKRRVSFKRVDSETDVQYETPDTSPERATSTSAVSACQQVNAEQSTLSAASDTDNKSLELLVAESYDNLRLICAQHQKLCEQERSLSNYLALAKCLYVLAEKETDLEAKKKLRVEAHSAAVICSKVSPQSYLAFKWLAMTKGRMLDHMPINEKVKFGFEFKEHLDNAINLNDSDYLLFYLRGRWSFKMCSLSWAEKYGIKLIFGKLPDACLDDAYSDFLRVESLHKSKSKGNLLHLAKCLIQKNDIASAVEFLEMAKRLPTKTAEHQVDNDQIEMLLKKHVLHDS